MRRMILCAMLVVAGVCANVANASAGANSTYTGDEKPKDAIVFAVSEHDFGRIDERGKPVSHTFEFTNEGSAPLVVTRVITSCKCTSAEATKKPVQPGEKGSVIITYNPRKQSGQVYRAIQVLTSQGRAVVTIKGRVE